MHADEMFDLLREKLDGLDDEDGKHFHLAKRVKADLVQFFRKTLHKFNGQFHPPAAFARMLDPLHAAESRKAAEKMWGKSVFKEIPHEGPKARFSWSASVKPLVDETDELEEVEETEDLPWRTQFLREFTTEMMEEYSRENHNRHQWGFGTNGQEDADGRWTEEWAIEDVVSDTINRDGTVT